jgi:hypothetical protein
MRFNKAGASMKKMDNSEAGEALDQVNRIRPVVDRLRALLSSATALDLQASAKGYWAPRSDEGDRAITSP